MATEDAATPGNHPKLVVHHLNNSRSQRILWLLEELELPYEIKKYQRTAEMLAPPELTAVNPLGNAPVITDGALNLAESGAIVEYIIQKYGKGRAQPLESGIIDNLYYTHYAEASLMPLLVNKLVFRIIPERVPFFLRPFLKGVFGMLSSKMIEPRLKLHAKMIEDHLAKTDGWFAGGPEPTSADYMMIFALEAWVSEKENQLGPKIKEYIARVHARPAYQRALEKGGEYAYAKASL
ncbi:thioredoxin-like protein [Lentinus tigrinus ALCF2SS1-7]|uniref:glutathione transferase n=1 Tax=Lentinus tigrinus ALCF2SS1-6 TaxID=1328759 RepID=A0A5C2SRA8_9APHY|nr:thioredoxin-like protein [Lentinus tigrinus ALCF2SS1-6]RPD78926.1 thioredoxin-like protein [Lentinus tigrinus ALCF2SS1-7]